MRCLLASADRLYIGSDLPAQLAEQGVDISRGATILGGDLGHLAMLGVDHLQDTGMLLFANARHRPPFSIKRQLVPGTDHEQQFDKSGRVTPAEFEICQSIALAGSRRVAVASC